MICYLRARRRARALVATSRGRACLGLGVTDHTRPAGVSRQGPRARTIVYPSVRYGRSVAPSLSFGIRMTNVERSLNQAECCTLDIPYTFKLFSHAQPARLANCDRPCYYRTQGFRQNSGARDVLPRNEYTESESGRFGKTAKPIARLE